MPKSSEQFDSKSFFEETKKEFLANEKKQKLM